MTIAYWKTLSSTFGLAALMGLIFSVNPLLSQSERSEANHAGVIDATRLSTEDLMRRYDDVNQAEQLRFYSEILARGDRAVAGLLSVVRDQSSESASAVALELLARTCAESCLFEFLDVLASDSASASIRAAALVALSVAAPDNLVDAIKPILASPASDLEIIAVALNLRMTSPCPVSTTVG